MANSVTGYNYGTYPTSIQGFTSPTQISSVAGSNYSQYDVKPYSHGSMISLSAPAPQYSSHYNYTQPSSSLAYNQHASSATIYNTFSTQATQSHIPTAQQGTSMPVAAAAAQQAQQQQQLAAAVSLQRAYQQSPPYSNQPSGTGYSNQPSGTGYSNQPSGAGYSSALNGATTTQAVYEQYKQQAAVYEAQAAQVAQAQAAAQQQQQQQQAVQQAQQQAVQQAAAQQQAAAAAAAAAVAAQQAQAQQVYQHKKDIIDTYSSSGNRLQANIIPHNTSHIQQLPSKNTHIQSSVHSMHSPSNTVHRSSNYSTTHKLDSIQTFSAPPKPSPHRSTRLPLSCSSNIMRRTTDPPLTAPSTQNIFRKNHVNVGYKIPFQKNIHQHVCKICKVSCASMKTFKDHEEGQRHKKRVAQLEQEKMEDPAGPPPSGVQYKCVLCDVTCTGEETFNAHRRGVKHYKAEKLYKDLGNEIPAPIIRGEEEPKPDVPIVGAHLIETKTDPAKSKKIIYHCKMCDCSFNDEYAKDLHLKGRRHRLNYKKTYDPNLKVDVQPSKREKIAEQKARRRAEDQERRRNMVENRRHMWEQNRWRAEEEWREWAEARSWHQYEAMKIQHEKDYEERCASEKERCKKMGLPEPTLPPAPQLPPPPPRMNNSRFMCPGMDEFLMIQKQTMVSPSEEDLDTLQDLVMSVDKALRSVSDTLSAEAKDHISAQGINSATPARIISTMHKTGKLTKAILLNDDLSADIAVLCTEKPTQFILNNVYNKFKELYKCGDTTKVVLLMEKAKFVISQGEKPNYIVNVQFTSPAFDVSVSEDERRAECLAKVLERTYCLSTMGDVNEAGWYKIHIKPNAPAVIVLRILTSLRQEPGHQLKDLSVQALQVLIFLTIKTFGPIKNVAPTLVLRRFLEVLAAGYLLTEELIPPWSQNKGPVASLIGKLDLEQREAITLYAQHSLRCIALGDLHKVLLIPPPPRPSPPVNFSGPSAARPNKDN